MCQTAEGDGKRVSGVGRISIRAQPIEHVNGRRLNNIRPVYPYLEVQSSDESGPGKKSKTAFVNQNVHVRFSHIFYLIHYCNKNTAAPYRQSIPHERMSFPSAVNTAINNPQLRLLNCLRASAKPILTFLGLPSMRAAQIVAQSGLDVSIFGLQHAIPH